MQHLLKYPLKEGVQRDPGSLKFLERDRNSKMKKRKKYRGGQRGKAQGNIREKEENENGKKNIERGKKCRQNPTMLEHVRGSSGKS